MSCLLLYCCEINTDVLNARELVQVDKYNEVLEMRAFQAFFTSAREITGNFQALRALVAGYRIDT